MMAELAAVHRGGTGTPLVLLHGLTGSWHVWQPVLPALETEHEVLALTLPGHHGGPALDGGDPAGIERLADGVEAILDEHGIATAHVAGNSLGGWLALELGRRGRARSVIAFSPAGGWSRPRDLRRVVRLIGTSQAFMRRNDPLRVAELLRRPRLRRLAFFSVMEHGERVPAARVPDLLAASLGCTMFDSFLDWVRTTKPIGSWHTAADYPVRLAWAQRDRTIPFARYGRPILDAIPEAEHVTLPGVGHVPMYDDPRLVVRTILEVSKPIDQRRNTPMSTATETTLDGEQEGIVLRRWGAPDPTQVVVLVHGYGEHGGRYEHVAQRLVADGAVVYAPDHRGHGRSEGEPALVNDIEDLVVDVEAVVARAHAEHPGLPVVVLGHSMGGIIAARLAQRGNEDLAGLVLSSPAIGGNPDIEALLQMDPIPDVPIDPSWLSRDASVGEAYANDPLVYHGRFKRPTLEALFGGIRAVAEGPRLAVPTMWIHGENDPLVPIAGTREAVERIRGEGFEEHIYPDALHELLNETNRDEVLDELAAFVDDATRQHAAA